MNREIEVLKAEYKRAVDNPLFDDPKDYCVLLDLIQDRIEENLIAQLTHDLGIMNIVNGVSGGEDE